MYKKIECISWKLKRCVLHPAFLIVTILLIFLLFKSPQAPEWVQAIGSIGAILLAIWLYEKGKNDTLNDKRQSVLAIIKALIVYLEPIQKTLEEAKEDTRNPDPNRWEEVVKSTLTESFYHDKYISEFRRILKEVPALELRSADAVTDIINIRQGLIAFEFNMKEFMRRADDAIRKEKRLESHYQVFANNVLKQITAIKENYVTLNRHL